MNTIDNRRRSRGGAFAPPWSVPWAIFACLLWSTAFVGIKVGLRYVPPLTFAGVRFTLAGLILVPLCLRMRVGLGELREHWRVVIAVGLLMTVILYGAFFLAMGRVGAGQGAIVLGCSPLVNAVLAHLMMRDDRMSAGKIFAIFLGIAGVAVIAVAREPWSATGLRELSGLGLITVSVFASGLANVLVARNRGALNPVLLNSAQLLLGGLVLLAIGLSVEGIPDSLPDDEFFAALGWLACVSATGFSIWFALLRHVKVSRLNMWKFVIPVFGAILSWSLLPDESPDAWSLIGMVCVATAVVLSQRQSAKEFLGGADASG